MRVALVHDWLNNLGGAERVLIELHKIFPKAPIHVLFFNKRFVKEYLPDATIIASSLQKFPRITKIYKYLFFLMPSAIESLDLSNFDLVISSSMSFSKGLVLRPQTKHICYCYSPARFLWDRNTEYGLENKKPNWLVKISQHLLRIWDRQAAERVDEFVAISKTVQARIQKYYQKKSKVVYPPLVLTPDDNQDIASKDYYLIVSRLYDYKNIDVAVEAFNKMGKKLVIIGIGPEQKKLKKQAKKNISFLGNQDDATVKEFYANCKAFIMPQEEDFGMTAVEAMSFGKPVLALKHGGASETIVGGKTGEFFDDPIPEAIADCVIKFEEKHKNYNQEFIQQHAQKFSLERFKEGILRLIA